MYRDPESGWQLAGNPTEGVLMTLALKGGLDPAMENSNAPRSDEITFESEYRFMATLHHDHEGNAFVRLMGAPGPAPSTSSGWSRRSRSGAGWWP